MNDSASGGAASNLNGAGLMAVGESVSLPADFHPEHVLHVTGMGHDFDGVMVLAPDDGTGHGQCNLVHVTCMVVGPAHDAFEILLKDVNVGYFSWHMIRFAGAQT